MILGLLVDVSSEEILEHLEAKVRFHEGKVEFYDSQIAALRIAGDRIAGDDWVNATNNPISSLETSVKNHIGRAEFFSYLAKHVIPNETYRLSESDLIRIELISRVF